MADLSAGRRRAPRQARGLSRLARRAARLARIPLGVERRWRHPARFVAGTLECMPAASPQAAARAGRSGDAAHALRRQPTGPAMRLLLVEDDPMIGRAMGQGLRDAGFTVDWVTDGDAAALALANGVYDLAVLDLGLPGKDGMELLRELRARRDLLPVLIVTARDAVADRIDGLNAGADDYVLKPFDLDELVARVRALLRRHAGGATPLLECGGLTLDTVRREVRRNGEEIQLSAREFALLEALMQRPGAVLSRVQLEDAVYGWGEEVGSNAVEVHLHNLRRKLGPETIRNVRGAGYKVAAE